MTRIISLIDSNGGFIEKFCTFLHMSASTRGSILIECTFLGGSIFLTQLVHKHVILITSICWA
ncbi:hypothetical protein NUSPORA_01763 [Nucleospora cyclopteri]